MGQEDGERFFDARDSTEAPTFGVATMNETTNIVHGPDTNAVGESGTMAMGNAPLDVASAAIQHLLPSDKGPDVHLWGAGHVCLRLRPDKLIENDWNSSEEDFGSDGDRPGLEDDEVCCPLAEHFDGRVTNSQIFPLLANRFYQIQKDSSSSLLKDVLQELSGLFGLCLRSSLSHCLSLLLWS